VEEVNPEKRTNFLSPDIISTPGSSTTWTWQPSHTLASQTIEQIIKNVSKVGSGRSQNESQIDPNGHLDLKKGTVVVLFVVITYWISPPSPSHPSPQETIDNDVWYEPSVGPSTAPDPPSNYPSVTLTRRFLFPRFGLLFVFIWNRAGCSRILVSGLA